MLRPPEMQENDIGRIQPNPKRDLIWKKLLDPNIRTRFTARIKEQISNTKNENADTSTRSKNLVDVISQSANEILPEKEKLFDTATKFQDDEHLNQLLSIRSNKHKESNA